MDIVLFAVLYSLIIRLLYTSVVLSVEKFVSVLLIDFVALNYYEVN